MLAYDKRVIVRSEINVRAERFLRYFTPLALALAHCFLQKRKIFKSSDAFYQLYYLIGGMRIVHAVSCVVRKLCKMEIRKVFGQKGRYRCREKGKNQVNVKKGMRGTRPSM